MKIKIDLDDIQHALEVISKTAPPTSGNINFVGAKGKLKLLTTADLSRAQIIVPCEIEGEGEFAVSMQALNDAIKNRSRLELAYLNSVLHIKAGAYKAELATVDVIPQDVLDAGETKEWVLSTEQAAWLKSALRKVSLKPTPIISQWMPAGIKIGPKSAFVACYDTQHMSWTSSNEVRGDFEVVLPIDVMTAVVDVFHKASFKMIVASNSIQVVSKLVNVTLSIPSMDDLPTLDQVRAKIKEMSSVKAKTFKLAKEDLVAFLTNAKAVVGKERAEIAITAAAKGVELLIKTVQGQVKNVVKGIGNGGFKIDYEYFNEVVYKSGPELVLNVVDSSFVSLELENSTAMIALNQES
jgi:hypothetical protein